MSGPLDEPTLLVRNTRDRSPLSCRRNQETDAVFDRWAREAGDVRHPRRDSPRSFVDRSCQVGRQAAAPRRARPRAAGRERGHELGRHLCGTVAFGDRARGHGWRATGRAGRRGHGRRRPQTTLDHRRLLGEPAGGGTPRPASTPRGRVRHRELPDRAPGRHLRPRRGRELDAEHDAVLGRRGLVGSGLHRRGRRRGGHRHRSLPRRGARDARQGHLRSGPLHRVAGPEPHESRHVRPRHVHGRAHRRARQRHGPAVRRRHRHRSTGAWRRTPAS